MIFAKNLLCKNVQKVPKRTLESQCLRLFLTGEELRIRMQLLTADSMIYVSLGEEQYRKGPTTLVGVLFPAIEQTF